MQQLAAIELETQPSFRRVAECLYRHTATGIYYGLVKRSGKQFRKSFKTIDRKLAERQLSDDLLTCDAERIKDISALYTVVGGRLVHDAASR